MAAPKNGSSRYCVAGCSASGTLKLRPSSPPVKSDSCDASVRNADATASVIIAKKIAFTRKLNRPISSASQRLRGRSWERRRFSIKYLPFGLSLSKPCGKVARALRQAQCERHLGGAWRQSSVRHRIQPLRPPQQHHDHQPDVGEHREL